MSIVQKNTQPIDQIANRTIGQAANQAASRAVFDLYRIEKSPNTQKAQRRAISHFARFLAAAGTTVTADQLWQDPAAWGVVTWGLVEGHKVQSLNDGVSVATINQRLSVIKTYSRLAHQAGHLPDGEILRIRAVRGFHGAKVQKNVRANTLAPQKPKKTTNTLTAHQVRTLFGTLPTDHTPRGTRDLLLAYLLFEHGLRSSEILTLDRSSFRGRCLIFDRPKVGLTDCSHHTRQPTQAAYAAYIKVIGHDRPFWQSTRKNGALTGNALVRSSLDRAVRRWGPYIGINNLSAHDARHTLATKLARDGMTATKLMDFFSWSSLGTAQRYVERAKVGNEGVGSIWS